MKKRDQTILKNMAMEGMIKTKEKNLLDHRENQNGNKRCEISESSKRFKTVISENKFKN